MSDMQLEILASRAGLAVDWVDAEGRAQRVAPEVLRRVLAGLGHNAEDSQQIEASLLALQLQQQEHQLPPLLTADLGQPVDLSSYFAPYSPCHLCLEDGSELELYLDDQAILPAIMTLGYHQARILGQGFTLAVAPPHCHTLAAALDERPARAWGLGVQVYSLQRPGAGGCGDCMALETLARAAGERGADALAISPLHAMFSCDPTLYSPYSPSSRLFLNSVYAAPAAILGEQAVRQAIEACELEEELQALDQLTLIDWPRVARAKQLLLATLYADFRQGEHPLFDDFNLFRQVGGEALENHCRFEALQADCLARGQTTDWRYWPAEWQDPHSPQLAAFATEHSVQVGYYAFAQWLTACGLARAQSAARASGMAVGLIADLAVGADGGGSQAWSRQGELLASLTVGAPPDQLNRIGQGWGISAFSPDGLKRHGYRAFIEMLRANFAQVGGLRIDHVMGLQRLWVIPLGGAPNDGAYLYYPVDDLLRLLCLESHRHQAIVLGEDLGTVPAGLREKLSARAILGIRVLLFEQDHGACFKPILDWPDTALATTSTHDLPPLNGWWHARDIDWNRQLGIIDAQAEWHWRERRQRERDGLLQALRQDPQNFRDASRETEQLIDASVRYLGHTRAPLVLLPLEDALGLAEQPNLPGTVASHPNWRQRLPGDCASLLDDPDAARRLELLACARAQALERDRGP